MSWSGSLGRNAKLLRWHSWRRYSAAQLQMLGARTHSILRWGGRASPSLLKIYAYPSKLVVRARGTTAGGEDRRSVGDIILRTPGDHAAAMGALAADRHRLGCSEARGYCAIYWDTGIFDTQRLLRG